MDRLAPRPLAPALSDATQCGRLYRTIAGRNQEDAGLYIQKPFCPKGFKGRYWEEVELYLQVSENSEDRGGHWTQQEGQDRSPRRYLWPKARRDGQPLLYKEVWRAGSGEVQRGGTYQLDEAVV